MAIFCVTIYRISTTTIAPIYTFSTSMCVWHFVCQWNSMCQILWQYLNIFWAKKNWNPLTHWMKCVENERMNAMHRPISPSMKSLREILEWVCHSGYNGARTANKYVMPTEQYRFIASMKEFARCESRLDVCAWRPNLQPAEYHIVR